MKRIYATIAAFSFGAGIGLLIASITRPELVGYNFLGFLLILVGLLFIYVAMR